jgi:hypothetical protein
VGFVSFGERERGEMGSPGYEEGDLLFSEKKKL